LKDGYDSSDWKEKQYLHTQQGLTRSSSSGPILRPVRLT
jgi:hypothetical protein